MHPICSRALGLFSVLLLATACQRQSNTVSGTIEVDEVHVGPRMGGRVEKIFAQEGDKLRAGQAIVELDAAELKARRDLAAAQINSAIHDTEAQAAQLEFMRDDALRQQDLLKRKVVSPSDAERASSIARAQEKIVEAARMRVAQARAQLADIDAQLAEMQVKAPTDSILEVLSVKVGDVLAANREVATLILPAAFMGARLCSGTVARIDQSGGAGSHPRRFVSREGFRRNRRTDKSPGRIHAAQRPDGRRQNPPGFRSENSTAKTRRTNCAPECQPTSSSRT